VDQHRTLVESMDSIQFEDLFSASFIDSFRGMHNEGQIASALAKFARKIWFHGRRVGPGEL
jgi:hypothetical protein